MYAGCDPGYADGAIAILYDDDSVLFFDIDRTPLSITPAIPYLEMVKFSLLEHVASRPRQSSQSVSNFGKGIGWCETIHAVAKVSYEEVVPQKWQEIITPKRSPAAVPKTLAKKERDKIKAKNRRQLKEDIYNFCRKRFPKVDWRSFNKDTNRADALAIALYARFKHQGLLNTP